MALTFPVPNDSTYDYTPIAGPQVQIGTNLLSMWTVQGTVSTIIPPVSVWQFIIDVVNPDGSGSTGVALYPASPASLPSYWWGRMALWKRAAKLADGGTLTAGDGSKWRYPAGEDGRMTCTQPGTTFARGARKFRGELTTNPNDLWICDDATWDWLPVTDGSTVSVGDTVTFLWAQTGVIDEIDTATNDYYTRTAFSSSGAQIGWYDVTSVASVPGALLNVWTFFQRLSKPSTDTSFRAADGSRWDYVGSSLYYCWGRGTEHSPGAVFHRGEIAGGLFAIIT